VQGVKKIKGISPLIATVLLIAFTVAVGGLINIWLTSFTKTQTQAVGSQASTSIACSNGGLSLSSLYYCNPYLTGTISNIGTVSLGNISLIITFTNYSMVQKLYLQLLGSTVNVTSTCCGNVSLWPSELISFNGTIGGSNYDIVKVVSNCSGVSAFLGSNDFPHCPS
jgi:flagellin-like protein